MFAFNKSQIFEVGWKLHTHGFYFVESWSNIFNDQESNSMTKLTSIVEYVSFNENRKWRDNMTVVGKLLFSILLSALVSALLVKIIRILLYKQHRPLLTRKVDLIFGERFVIHSSTWQSGAKIDWRYQTQEKDFVILDVYSYVFFGWKSLKKYSFHHNLYLLALFLFIRNYPVQAVVCLKIRWDL